MNAAGFWRGIGVALLLSVAGGAVFVLLAPLLGAALTLRGVLLLVASGCLLDLLQRNPGQPGRLLAGSVALLLAVALVTFDPPLWFWWVLPAGYLWLLRSLARGVGPLHALLDGGLTVVGLALALASLRHSGSVWLALWCWLLLQAIAAAVASPRRVTSNPGDRFDSARRNAEAALRGLQQPRSPT